MTLTPTSAVAAQVATTRDTFDPGPLLTHAVHTAVRLIRDGDPEQAEQVLAAALGRCERITGVRRGEQ